MIFSIFFSVFPVFSSEAASAEIQISKIKVFLDDEELYQDSEADGKIRLSTILSYTKFRENKKNSQEEFKKEVEKTKLRLTKSGLFYSAEVETRASRKNPGTMVVYISVRRGFLFRFGGGNAYGLFGKAAVGGKRNMLKGYLGYNKNGLSYIDENTFGLPLILGGSICTNVPQWLVEKAALSFDAVFRTGFFINPDLKLGIDVKALTTINGADSSTAAASQDCFTEFTISPFYSQNILLSEKFIMNAELRLYNYFSANFQTKSFEAAINADYNPHKKITLAGLVCGGSVISSTNKAAEESAIAKINLEKASVDLYDRSGLANRGIRSGYSTEELATDCYILLSTELRWKALNFKLPPFFPVEILPYLFSDLCLAHEYSDKETRVLDAYGVGLQINFDCPVFAYFNFSYGINHHGKGKFVFAAMQGF